MSVRFAVYALVATLAIGGTALVADALVTSDAEHLAALGEELPEGRDGIDGVLRWSDPSRVPVTVSSGSRRTIEYVEGDEAAFADAVAEALAPLQAGSVDVVQRSVNVHGDRGTIAMRARADGELLDITVRLERNGQGWLVTSLAVR